MSRFLKIFSTLILCFLTTQLYASNTSALKTMLSDWRIQHHVPAVIAMIATQQKQKKILAESGTIAKDSNTAINRNTLFGVGSITKTVVSVVILKLEAAGALNLNDPIKKYLPQYPRWGDITIKQLLDMTSGIYNYSNDPAYKEDMEKGFTKYWSTDTLINIAYQHSDDFKPGTNWNYTNTSYLILGKIIEEKTHHDLQQVCERLIFYPLAMHHSFFLGQHYLPVFSNHMAKGYYNGHMIKPGDLGDAAGGLVMDITDLQKFVDHLFIKKDLLPPKQLAEMLQGVPIPAGKIKPSNSSYGLGVTITNNQTDRMIWYTGVTPNYTAIYLYIPEKNISLFALASFDRFGDKDYDLLFPEKSLVQNLLANHP